MTNATRCVTPPRGRGFLFSGAAQESNLPSVGLPRLTGFEDRLGHRARAAPGPATLVAGASRGGAQDAAVADAACEAVGVEALEQELRRAARDSHRVAEGRQR